MNAILKTVILVFLFIVALVMIHFARDESPPLSKASPIGTTIQSSNCEIKNVVSGENSITFSVIPNTPEEPCRVTLWAYPIN